MASAQELIDGAATLVGIKSATEPLDTLVSADALRRLNQMVSGWNIQSGTILAVERNVFNITANKQWYSIGTGGDFNVPRPNGIEGAGLLLTGLQSARSCAIGRVGTTATVTLAAHGFTVGQEIFIFGANQQAYNQSQIVVTVPTANTFTFQVQGAPATPATGTITAQAYSSTAPVEIPRAVITLEAYEAIQIKTLTNALFTLVYYEQSQPLGKIFLWPMPNTSTNQLVLYLQTQFTGFADLDTDYTFPETPGYADALEYNLALRIAPANGTLVPPDVKEDAGRYLALIKRGNAKIVDVANETAWATSGNRRWGYNIDTGNY